MGRTNPTFRDALRGQEQRYRPFRRGLRRRYRTDFDALFEHARQFADAAGYQNHADPETVALVAMLLGHQVELRRLNERLDDLEADGGD